MAVFAAPSNGTLVNVIPTCGGFPRKKALAVWAELIARCRSFPHRLPAVTRGDGWAAALPPVSSLRSATQPRHLPPVWPTKFPCSQTGR